MKKETIKERFSKDKGRKGSLAEFFKVAPFSVLNTSLKVWKDRKNWWKVQINDGETRDQVLGQAMVAEINDGTSIFDAMLAEVLTHWYTNEGHAIFDPFAGSTTFGFVAGRMKRRFLGIELRKEQCDYNNKISKGLKVHYFCEDGRNIDKLFKSNAMDMFFSCPPYADLEVYSDDPNDLSNMTHEQFFEVYREVLIKSYDILKTNRFAVLVVGEVRDKDGVYIGLVPKTIEYMVEAGYKYYNEIILETAVGTLPMRVGKWMNVARKIGGRHQTILVFYKGDQPNVDIRTEFPELIPKSEKIDYSKDGK